MITLPHPLVNAASAHGGRVVLEDELGCLTTLELLDSVRRRAGNIASQGVTQSSRVALLGPVSNDWVVSLHAIGWLGATVVPLRYAPPLLTEQLSQTGCQFMIAHNHFVSQPSASTTVKLLNVYASISEALPPPRAWPLDEERIIILGSGTTGTPQPTALTTQQLFFSAMASALRLGHLSTDRWLLCLPCNHIGGLSILMRTLWYGTNVRLHQSFDAQRVAAELDSGDITQVSLVPTMLQRVLDVRRVQPFPRNLRFILLGGATTPDELLKRCQKIDAPVCPTWGMSECGSQIATRSPEDLQPGLPPLAFTTITQETGKPSRLSVQGPIAPGTKKHWVTPDWGRVGDDGRVYIGGRCDDVIVSGGEKIHPEDIEHVLREHRAIDNLVVVARFDPHWGQRAEVIAVPAKDTAEPTLEALQTWCQRKLPPFASPKAVHWSDALPHSDMDKLSRQALSVALGQGDARFTQTFQEALRNRARREAPHIDAGVHHAQNRASSAVLAGDLVSPRQGTPAQTMHRDLDRQALSDTNRSFEVSLGVHHGHTPAQAIEGPLPAAKNARYQFFVGGMAVFEKNGQRRQSPPGPPQKSGRQFDARRTFPLPKRIPHKEI